MPAAGSDHKTALGLLRVTSAPIKHNIRAVLPLREIFNFARHLGRAGARNLGCARILHYLAPVILAAALLGPSVFALWASVASYNAGLSAREASVIPDLLASARYGAVQQELTEQMDWMRPDPALRLRHSQEEAEVISTLEQAGKLASPALARAVGALAAIQSHYRAITENTFSTIGAAAVGHAGAAPGALLAHALAAGLLAETQNALDREAVFNNHERRIQQQVLLATPVVLAIDFMLVAAVLLLIRAKGNRDRQAAAREAAVIERSERRFRALVQNSLDVVIISGAGGVITYQSPTTAHLWGYAGDRLLGRSVRDLIHPDDEVAFDDLWRQITLTAGMVHSMESRTRLQDGSWRQVELILTNLTHEPAVAGIVLTARDIEDRKAFELQLTQRAFFDPLTGLPNRLLLYDRLKQALVRAMRRRRAVALMFIDLDNFKLINDSLGHATGDQLLVQVAARLLACGRAEDTVARLGGDEFVVLIDNLVGEADAAVVAENTAQQFHSPFLLDGREVVVTASIGVALGHPDRDNAESMLRNADVAMYRAKSNGKGQHVLFDLSMHRDSLARLELENDLRHALERDEFRLHYQPIIDMASGRMVEAEALIRWQHPTRGLIAPKDFIPVAEEMGLIVPLGHWVIEHACREAAKWAAAFPVEPPIAISVNVSPREFRQPDLDAKVAEILGRTGLRPDCLKLEITEGAIMEDVDWTIAVMGRLKKVGVKLAIDDFGTGYSSLAYLKRLPLDVLKIDQSFVSGIGSVREDSAIVRAILSLAELLNLDVTGEGIETAEQAELLSEWNCGRGQGYFFLRPVDAEGAQAFLQTSRRSMAGWGSQAASDGAESPLAHSFEKSAG